MLSRPQVVQSGQEGRMPAGVRTLSGVRRISDATNGNVTWPVAYVLAGWIDRSGPGAGYGDTTPSADQILAAVPDLVRGDSFPLLVTSSVAFANTLVAGAGITFAGTTGVAASSTREYLLTLLSDNKRTRVAVASTTNADPKLTNMSIADIQNIGIGMLVTGTGIGASAVVSAINLSAGTVTLSVNSTATADNVAVTFTPNIEMRGLRTAGN
jgi:hypothetical protein